MNKNSTRNVGGSSNLKKKNVSKDNGPKKETLDTLIAYAKSVSVIETKSLDRLLITLN